MQYSGSGIMVSRATDKVKNLDPGLRSKGMFVFLSTTKFLPQIGSDATPSISRLEQAI
jgi:hypothetical protein